MSKSLRVASLALVCIFSVSCGSGGSGGNSEGNGIGGGNQSPVVQPTSGSNPDPTPLPPIDNFVFTVDPAIGQEFGVNYDDYIQTNIGGAIAPLNTIDNLFRGVQVPVTFQFCDRANAFYSPGQRTITLCDELIDQAASRLGDSSTSEGRLDGLVRAVDMMIFVAYHEIGHAMDDLSGISIGGNSESVADAIATVLSVRTNQPFAALWAAAYFSENTEGSFAAVYGSGVDRAGDIVCWTIGSSSRLSAALPGIALDLVDSGRDCVAEYANQLAFVSDLIPTLMQIPPSTSLASAPLEKTNAFAKYYGNKSTSVNF